MPDQISSLPRFLKKFHPTITLLTLARALRFWQKRVSSSVFFCYEPEKRREIRSCYDATLAAFLEASRNERN